MSFLTVVKADAAEVETAVVAGLKTGLNYVENVVVTDIVPELEAAFAAALETFGQTELAALISALKPAAPVVVPTEPAV